VSRLTDALGRPLALANRIETAEVYADGWVYPCRQPVVEAPANAVAVDDLAFQLHNRGRLRVTYRGGWTTDTSPRQLRGSSRQDPETVREMLVG
jgi:hypothetical protein